MNHLFKQRNIRRICAYVEEDNLASQKLCQKLGMRQEGFSKNLSLSSTPKMEHQFLKISCSMQS